MKDEAKIESTGRKTYTSVYRIAQCEDCDQIWETANAVGLAARHCDLTGHTIVVDVNTTIIFEAE